jgi:hypothetical protein
MSVVKNDTLRNIETRAGHDPPAFHLLPESQFGQLCLFQEESFSLRAVLI